MFALTFFKASNRPQSTVLSGLRNLSPNWEPSNAGSLDTNLDNTSNPPTPPKLLRNAPPPLPARNRSSIVSPPPQLPPPPPPPPPPPLRGENPKLLSKVPSLSSCKLEDSEGNEGNGNSLPPPLPPPRQSFQSGGPTLRPPSLSRERKSAESESNSNPQVRHSFYDFLLDMTKYLRTWT